MGQIKKSLDFGCWFISSQEEKIFYKIREGANFLHDFVYMSSYINDSECDIKNIKFRNKSKLLIPISRIRWELFKKEKELISVASEISISNVEDYYFQLPKDFYKINMIEIKDIYCDYNTENIIIANKVIAFKIIIKIKEKKTPTIILKDI